MQKVTLAEQQAYEQLQSILSEISQWNDEEDLRSDMEEIGGRVWYCHYWEEHYSMVELTEDRNGKFNVDYVLDDAVTPEVRRGCCTVSAKGICGPYAGMGHFASECTRPGTDEVCFSGRSRIAPHASPQ